MAALAQIQRTVGLPEMLGSYSPGVLVLRPLHQVNKILSGSRFCYALPAHPLLHDFDFSVSFPFQALIRRFFQLPEKVVCEDRPPMFFRLKSAQDR